MTAAAAMRLAKSCQSRDRMASRSWGDRPPCDARELRQQGRAIVDSAVEAARSRFRPIVMTSFASRSGAAGSGERRRRQRAQVDRHRGIHRMIASTRLAVLFVPSFFVVVQRLDE